MFIAGAGGLGSPVALYLAAAGIGSIRIVDPDRVALSDPRLRRDFAYVGGKWTGAAGGVAAMGRFAEVEELASGEDARVQAGGAQHRNPVVRRSIGHHVAGLAVV